MKKVTKFPSEKELKAVRKRLNFGPASELLRPNATPVEKTKYRLCEKFVIYKRENNLTQKELAEILEIDEALMSKILHYHIREFTTDRLLNYLARLFPQVEVKVVNA